MTVPEEGGWRAFFIEVRVTVCVCVCVCVVQIVMFLLPIQLIVADNYVYSSWLARVNFVP